MQHRVLGWSVSVEQLKWKWQVASASLWTRASGERHKMNFWQWFSAPSQPFVLGDHCLLLAQFKKFSFVSFILQRLKIHLRNGVQSAVIQSCKSTSMTVRAVWHKFQSQACFIASLVVNYLPSVHSTVYLDKDDSAIHARSYKWRSCTKKSDRFPLQVLLLCGCCQQIKMRGIFQTLFWTLIQGAVSNLYVCQLGSLSGTIHVGLQEGLTKQTG